MDPLIAARTEALERIEALRASRDELIVAAQGANIDDEHDPEGATIAFEREQLAALLAQAEASLAAVDAAVAAREAGTYGVCAVCGGEIGSERLEARPAATTCVTCAQRAR